jgi:flagellar biosynthesis protein FliQ
MDNKIKDYGLVWWITEIIGLVLIIVVTIFEVCTNVSLLTNNSVSFNQKLVNLAGVFIICYGWSFAADWVVKKLRKYIHKLID